MTLFDWFVASPAPKGETLDGMLQMAQKMAQDHFELIIVVCAVIGMIDHLINIMNKSLWVITVVMFLAFFSVQLLPILPHPTSK